MRHPSLLEFEKKLRALFDTIDDRLEREYGAQYQLHPARAPSGTTSSRASDGLFNVGASFTPGYGSRIGRGYVVQVELSTLDRVPSDVREQIEARVADMVAEKLPYYFPDRTLRVSRDRNVYKIHGDLSLGSMH